nr:MAG TPA: hypothetical protein [Crassvirales sp.]
MDFLFRLNLLSRWYIELRRGQIRGIYECV